MILYILTINFFTHTFVITYIYIFIKYMSQTNNLLFYSTHCRICASLLNILKNEHIIGHFRLICVDDPKIMRQLPKDIDRVPTLIIQSLHRKYIGNEIFVWLQTIKNNRNVQNNNTNNNIHETQTINNVRNPIGFITQEMSGLSDTYAYTNIDEIPRHAYQLYSDLDKSSIFTAPETQNKINSQLQPVQIKSMEAKREKQDKDIRDFFLTQRNNGKYLEERRNNTEKMINDIVDKHQKNIIRTLDK